MCGSLLLSTVPEGVVWFHILPYLRWNDLLRLRRVAQITKTIVMAYIRTYPERVPELEISLRSGSGMGFKQFLELDIPATKVYLNNEQGCPMWLTTEKLFWLDEVDEKMLQRPDPAAVNYYNRFLAEHGPLVKSLRVHTLSLYIHGKEWDFYEALVNLERMEAMKFGDGVGYYLDKQEADKSLHEIRCRVLASRDTRHRAHFCPSTLLALKHLKVGQQSGRRIYNLSGYTYYYTPRGHQLQYLSLPFNTLVLAAWASSNPQIHELLLEVNRFQVLRLAFQLLQRAVENSTRKQVAGLKTIDLSNYSSLTGYAKRYERKHEFSNASAQFLQLCVTCSKYGVKLTGVHPSWFKSRKDSGALPEWKDPKLGTVVKSLVGFSPEVFVLNMPNVERLEIPSTAKVAWPSDYKWPALPALKSLKIFVNSKLGRWRNEEVEIEFGCCFCWVYRFAWGTVEQVSTFRLFDLFFKNVQRLKLVELRLKFCEAAKKVAIPNTKDIVKACPNLRQLCISNWRGSNKQLTNLWRGLHNLEELTLESCKKLKMSAFFGKDKRNPDFLKLEKLKKLSLLKLDQMPEVGDALFYRVLCHMRLSHLIITSTLKDGTPVPLQSITLTGMECLLKGQFAKHIEHFPVSGWSLAHVSSETMTAFQRKFRCGSML